MKRRYQVVERKNSRALAEFLEVSEKALKELAERRFEGFEISDFRFETGRPDSGRTSRGGGLGGGP